MIGGKAEPKIGDHVLATKWDDGCPLDHYAVGYYAGSFDHFGQIRHLVNDAEGKPYRANGFRRVARVSQARAAWLISHFADFEAAWKEHRRSVWWWYRAPMSVPSCTREILRCSFCDKSRADVKLLIAGPRALICDECVDVCLDILADRRYKDEMESKEQEQEGSSKC